MATIIRGSDNVDTGKIISEDANGYVTLPNQPRFHAYGGTNYSSSGTQRNFVTFANTTINVGQHYSTSTGRFTAPVAGEYFFCFHVRIDNADNDYFRARVTKNGTDNYAHPHGIMDLGTNWDPRYVSLTCSGIVVMDEDDYVQPQVYADDDTVNIFISESNFTGFLLG